MFLIIVLKEINLYFIIPIVGTEMCERNYSFIIIEMVILLYLSIFMITVRVHLIRVMI